MTQAMMIEGSEYTRSVGSRWYEIVDYDAQCDAIFWKGETQYRGIVASWDKYGSTEFPVKWDKSAPQNVINAVLQYEDIESPVS